MQWEATPGAGFSPAMANSERPEPWLPINPDHRQRNVQAQLADSRSLLGLYRRLLHLRRTCPALHAGSYRSAAGAPEGTYIYYRTQGEQELLVALNFGAGELLLQLPEGRPGRVLLSTELDREELVQLTRCRLRAHEAIIVQLNPEAG